MSFRRLTLLCSALVFAITARADSTLPAVLQVIPGMIISPGVGPTTYDLRAYFGLPGVTGQIVQWDTTLGKFNMELNSSHAPRTVANFLGYVSAGSYNETIFDNIPNYRTNGYYIRGGTFKHTLSTTPITPGPTIPSEVYWSNGRGTIAMVHDNASDPNSATSAWFINITDNSTYLDSPTGSTVFGRVLGSGMTVVDALAAVPTYQTGNFDAIPLVNVGTAQTYIQIENYLVVKSIRTLSLYPTANNSDTVLSFSLIANSSPTVATATISGSSLIVTPVANSGNTRVTVRVTDTDGNFSEGIVTFSVIAQTAPAIIQQPASLTMPAGSTAVFFATATSYPQPFYQWRKNGVDIAGANDSTLMLRNISVADAANYSISIINLQGAAISADATLTVAGASANPGRLINLSARTNSGSGAQVLNVGFVVGGDGATGSLPVLIRGAGPALMSFGLPANVVLTDPSISLVRQTNGPVTIATNDNWAGSSQVANAATSVGAFPFTDVNSKDAGLLSTLSSNVYAVVASGVGATTGQVLAEIYDANSSYTVTTPRLINVSARAQVNTGDDILIAGFVISGNTPRTVLIRGVGPTLSSYSVTGFLADPQLNLYRTQSGISTLVASNDNWAGTSTLASASTQVGAFALTSGNDAALLITLPPGVYSAQVSGVNATTGIALVEVYEVY